MFKINKLIILVVGFILLLSLTSCDNGSKDVSAELEVLGLRTTIVVSAKLVDQQRLVTKDSFIASLYDEDDKFVTSQTFDHSLITVQEKEFKNLKQEHTYTVRLFATFNKKKRQLQETQVSTSLVGSEDIPVEIKTQEDFEKIAKDNTAYFELKNDINLNGLELKPFFTDSTPFKGNFNGNGFSISNFTLKQSTVNNGVFGYIDKIGVVENVKFVDVKFDLSRATDSNIGTVCGVNKGTIRNVIVENLTGEFRSSGAGNMNFGLFVGVNTDRGLIEDSYVINASLKITGRNLSKIGGFVAINELNKTGIVGSKSKIINCGTEAELTFSLKLASSYDLITYIGGFAAINETIIENSYANFKLEATTSKEKGSCEKYETYIGGFSAALLNTAQIDGCAAIVDIKYTSTDIITGAFSGFVAYMSKSSNISNSVLHGSKSLLQLDVTTPVSETITTPSEDEENEEEEDTTEVVEVEFSLLVSLFVASNEPSRYATSGILGVLPSDITNQRFTINEDYQTLSTISSLPLSNHIKEFLS